MVEKEEEARKDEDWERWWKEMLKVLEGACKGRLSSLDFCNNTGWLLLMNRQVSSPMNSTISYSLPFSSLGPG